MTLTLDKRIGLAKKSIFEIKRIVEDCRSQVVGGIKTALVLWESCTLPFLLKNCSAWLEIKSRDMDRICKVNNLFLQTILNCQKAPIPLMYFDLNVLYPTFRILKEKLNLYHHIIACLSPKAVIHQVLISQRRLHLKGLHSEIEDFLIKHEISDVRVYSKAEWKALVKRKIEIDNREFLIDLSKSYKKIDYLEMACEDYGMKDYFHRLDLKSSRIRFQERASCISKCMSHQPSNKKFIEAGFICLCNEGQIDNLRHWRNGCRLYSELKSSNKLETDEELTKFYLDIIQLRSNEL